MIELSSLVASVTLTTGIISTHCTPRRITILLFPTFGINLHQLVGLLLLLENGRCRLVLLPDLLAGGVATRQES